MNGRAIIIAISVALMLTTAAGSVLAGEDSGTETVDFFDPFSVEMDLADDSSMKVSWDIKVTDGVPVNVALLDENNYDKFSQGLRYEPYEGHQYNYTNISKRTVTVSEEGKYYLVVETTHSSMETSTIDYTVKWGEGAGGFWAPWCWPALIVLVLVFGIGILAWLRGRGRGSAVAPPTGAGPDTMTATELSPRPGPPDTPTDDPGYTGSGEPPAPGTGTVPPEPPEPQEPSASVYDPPPPAEPTVEGSAHLSPAPTPPYEPSVSKGPAPGTGVHHPPGEGTTQLSPQPEPPDMPTALESMEPPDQMGESSAPAREVPPEEPEVIPTTVPHYPEITPPDIAPPPPVEPVVEGVTQLSPQPEPPDMPADAMRPTGEGATELGPQPEPPDHPRVEERPPEADDGLGNKIDKSRKPDGPSGEPL